LAASRLTLLLITQNELAASRLEWLRPLESKLAASRLTLPMLTENELAASSVEWLLPVENKLAASRLTLPMLTENELAASRLKLQGCELMAGGEGRTARCANDHSQLCHRPKM
jgi:hypothetical protein